MKQHYFDKATAVSKVGKKIQTIVGFSGVPKGTTGMVIKADIASHSMLTRGAPDELYDLAIEWELPHRCKPLVDWFTKDEYERFLREVEPEKIHFSKPDA
jgi:hypothetical protein